MNLNELEYVKGEIFANIWHSPRIARIDARSGQVLAWIDLTSIVSKERHGDESVLNGIAYDKAGDRLFVTGKNWSRLFEIEVEGGPRKGGPETGTGLFCSWVMAELEWLAECLLGLVMLVALPFVKLVRPLADYIRPHIHPSAAAKSCPRLSRF